MSKFWEPTPWEAESEQRKEMFERGLKLLKQFGDIDLRNEFAVDNLLETLTTDDLEAYAFAQDYLASIKSGQTTQPASFKTASISPTNPTSELKSAPNETVFAALARFEEGKRRVAKAATVDKYVSHCRIFLKILAEGSQQLRLSDVTTELLHRYRDTIQKLPRKIDPAEARSIAELLEEGGVTISGKTLFSHVQSVCMFLNWCRDQQYPIDPSFEAILKDLRKKPKSKRQRKNYTREELAKLFDPNHYAKSERASDFWVPLLGLYTGAREAEICQLLTSDLVYDEPTKSWYIDVNDEAHTKTLKNESSRRQVPIHPILTSLGLINYRNARLAASEQTLFNEPRNKRGEFGAFSKRFNRYRHNVGIVSNRQNLLNFHSFRHTFSVCLYDELACEEYIVREILGHERAGGNEGLKTYSHGVALSKKIEVISKLNFTTDVSGLRRSW